MKSKMRALFGSVDESVERIGNDLRERAAVGSETPDVPTPRGERSEHGDIGEERDDELTHAARFRLRERSRPSFHKQRDARAARRATIFEATGLKRLVYVAMDPYNWGATAEEVAAAYPCDDLGFATDAVFHRAIDVEAPAPLVFRWLCQLRAAPYSYDLIDNFGRRSPPVLTPGLERLAIGQRAMVIFRVAGFGPNELTLRLGLRAAAGVMGDFAGTYRARAIAPGRTRIVVRILVRFPGGPYGRFLRRVIPWLDLIMFRKQLLTLKRYAERDAATAQNGV